MRRRRGRGLICWEVGCLGRRQWNCLASLPSGQPRAGCLPVVWLSHPAASRTSLGPPAPPDHAELVQYFHLWAPPACYCLHECWKQAGFLCPLRWSPALALPGDHLKSQGEQPSAPKAVGPPVTPRGMGSLNILVEIVKSQKHYIAGARRGWSDKD